MRSLLIATVMCAAALTFTGCSFTVSGPCNSFSHQSRIQGCGCGKVNCQDPACSGATCQDAGCDGCSGGVNFGQGAPCGLDNVVTRRPAKSLFASFGMNNRVKSCGCDTGDCGCDSTVVAPSIAPSMNDCGCDSGTCDGRCGRLRSRDRSSLGMGLFERGSECSDDCGGSCGGSCGTEMVSTQGPMRSRMGGMRTGGGMMQGGGMRAGGGMAMSSGVRGCGRFGCGRDGGLCLGCKARGMFGSGSGVADGCATGNCGRCSRCASKGRPYAGEIPHMAPQQGMAGQAPQYSYPYYTTRGPRDFLMANPPTIGY